MSISRSVKAPRFSWHISTGFVCAYDAQAVFVCFSQAHISIPSSTPNHPQPRLSFRCIHISGTGPNGACTRAHAHIPQGAIRLSGNNTHPGLNAEPPTAPLVLPLCTCSGYRPASGPVPGHTNPGLMCLISVYHHEMSWTQQQAHPSTTLTTQTCSGRCELRSVRFGTRASLASCAQDWT